MNMLAAQKIAVGMSPHAARRAARLQLGGIDQVTEQVRDVRLSAWVGSVARESRRCFRSLVRNPLFTGAAIRLETAPSTLHRWVYNGFIAGEQLTPTHASAATNAASTPAFTTGSAGCPAPQ